MKHISEHIRSLFKLNDSPNELALAFALGVFIAFTPTIGLHTISCLVFAWLFRLNKLAVFTAAFINNPWTMVPIYGFCMWVGIKITGISASTPNIAWKDLSLGNAFSVLKPYLWPFVAGTLAIGVVAAVASYFIIYLAVIRYRKI
jgi:uncharacterized protein (DUF2062 family)